MGDQKGDSGTSAGSVRCSCGTSIPVHRGSVGRELICPACAATFKVVWAVDPRTRAKVLTRMAATGKEIRIPQGSCQLVCACGQVLVARKDQAGKKVKCPVCGATMVIERFKDPQTAETRVRRAGEGPPPAAGSKEGTAIISAKSLGRTTRRRKAPTGAQDILCGCGEYLRVFEEHLEKKVMCPECGTLMKMEKSKDPQTSITQVRPRIIGKGEPPPKPDPDSWSLSDFS